MKVILEVFACLCELRKFTIDDMHANYDDFGDKFDTLYSEEYGCGNMKFFPKPATQDVLDKYRISIDEYNAITQELEKKLSFGSCNWCS